MHKLILLDGYARWPRRTFWSDCVCVLRNLTSMTPDGRQAFVHEKKLWLKGVMRQKLREDPSVSHMNEEKQIEIAAMMRYVEHELKDCQIPIELFTAKDGIMAWSSSRDRGWLAHAKAGLIVREVSGDHYSLLKWPTVCQVAELMADSLHGEQ